MKRHPAPSRSTPAARALLALMLAGGSLSLHAANQTWDGGGADANWSTVGNWNGDTASPGSTSVTTSTDIATFIADILNSWGLISSPILFDSTTQNIGGINFDLAAGNYYIGTTGGNALKLSDGGTIQILNTLTATNAVETINAPLALQGTTYTFANNSATGTGAGAGTLNFGGGITGTTGSTILTLGGSNTNANTISGVISNGTATSVAVTKTGAGTWVLTGANTYTGATTVGNGILKLDFSAAGAPVTNITSASSALKLTGGALNIVGASGGNSQTFNGTTLTGGGNTINIDSSSGGAVTLALGALAQSSIGSTLAILPSSTGGTVTVSGSAGTNVTATANTPLNSATGGYVSGAFATYGLYDYAMISGGNIVALGSANYTSNAGPNVDVTGGGYTTPSTTTSVNVIRFNTSGASTITNRTVYTSGGILVTPTVGASNVTITSSGATHSWETNRSNTSGSEGVIWQNNTSGYLVLTGANTFDNGKTGAANWVQAGPGTVQWNQTAGVSNGYTGQTYLNGGYTLVSANGNAVFGSQATAATINLGGGTLVAGSTFALDNAGTNLRPIALLNAGGGLAATNGNTLTVNGIISGNTGTGALVIGIPASSANGNTAGLLPGSGAGTANTTDVNATGTVALRGANTYTGGTIVDSGTLNINGIYALGGANYGGLTLNGGKLQYATSFSGNGSGDVTGATATLNLTALGGTIDVNGNSVTYANAIKSSGSGTLNISDSATTKGTLTLAGASTYTGNTALVAGNLSVTNTTGSATGSGAVAINGGTLSGSGIISGPVTLAGGTIAPGAAGTNLTLGSLTYNSGTLTFSLGAANASSKISTTNLTFSIAPTLSFNLSGVTSGETFTLFSSTNAITGASLFTGLAPITIGRTTLTAQQTGNLLQLVSSGSAGNLQWNNASATGDGSTWDITTSQNWRNTGTSSADLFYDADNVTFNDSNNGHYAVTLNSTVSPGSVTVDNSAGDYTISGTGTIAGSTSLVKNGSSRLTLSTANTYTGGTTINAGTIASGTTNALPTAGALTVQGTGTFDLAGNNQTVASLSDGGVSTGTVTSSSGTPTLTVNNASANTFGGIVTGSLGLTKTGGGTLTLSGANAYTGLTTVSTGTLNAATDSALGSSSSSTGGLLLNPSSGTATVNFTSATPSIASLASSGAGTSSVALGNGTTPATTTLTVGGGNVSTTFAGVISDVNTTTALGNLALVGTGTLTLSGANTYHGTTTISSGATLNVANAAALQNSSVDFSNGALTFGSTTTATAFGGLQGSNASQNLALTNTAGTPAAVALTVGGNGATTTYAGTLSGSGSLTKNGAGTLTLSGANTYTGTTSVGAGTLTLTSALGTSGTPSGAITLAQNATTLNISNATVYASSLTTSNTGNTSFVNISGTSAVTLSGALNINSNNGASNGGVFFTGGTLAANSVSIGRAGQNYGAGVLAGSANEGLYVNGGALNITTTLGVVGGNSGATMRLDSGSVTVGGTTTINTTANNRVSLLDVNGGTFTSNDTSGAGIQIGGTGTNYGELLVRGGTLNASTITFGTSSATTGVNVFNALGGTTYIGSGGIVAQGTGTTQTINLGSGTVATAPVIGASADWSSSMAMTLTNSNTSTAPTFQASDASSVAHNITLGGVLSGGGGLTKTGAGTLTLNAANTYTGATTISAGTLALGSSGSIVGSSIINNGTFNVSAVSGYAVGSGQTLSGSGTVIGATIINGSLNPGNSPGVITFSSNLTLAGTTNIELNSTTRGSGFDGVNVGGTLTYGGVLNLLFGSQFLVGGENFQVFTGLDGSSLPVLNSPSFTSIVLGGSYSTSLTNTSGVWTGTTGGYDFTFTESTGTLGVLASAVPEPSTYAALAGAAILGFAVLRRRRRA